MSLVGKFVQFDTMDDCYQVGELVYQITPTLYLFKPDEAPAKFMMLLDLETPPDNILFFNSRVELETWLTWLQTPESNDKVLKLVKKTES